MVNKAWILFLSFVLMSFCLTASPLYSIAKDYKQSALLTDWAVLTVNSINYDLNTNTFFLNSGEPFNISYKVNSGTPNFSIEVTDNQVIVFSGSYSSTQGLIEDIPLQNGTDHSINIKIEDSAVQPQSKESDINMEIR